MLLLPWALLPTITYASNAWHEDKDCGCHNLNSAWGIRTMFERGYNASLAHRATDLKTLKEKSKQTKSEKKLKQALTYELWRSLRAYRTQQITTKEDAEAEVIKILKDPHRNILLVLNNRVYVHREFYERSKHPGHAVMVREACQLLGCPNVIYVLIGVHGSLRAPSRHRRDSCPSHNEVGGFFLDFEPFRTASSPPDFVTTQDFASETTGGSGCDQRTLKLAINKEVGYEQCGVLVPNSYFGGGHGNITMWASEVTGQDSKLEPFASRKGKAMYRGSLHPDPDNVFSNERFCSEVAYGNYARISAFASSLDHPDEVDAKCVDGKRHACKLPPPSCVGIVNDFNSGLKAKARIDGKFLDDKDYRNHKYLLNLPGAASGSYSKNLNHLWRTGSVVMQWVHPFVEWYRPVRKAKFKRPSILGLLWSQYHPALEHGVTHLDVARYSVADYVKALEKDPETAERLGKEARRIHDTLLCPRCLAAFLVETFEAVNKHLGQSLVLDDGKRIAELLREHADCSTMAEVDEYRDHHHLPALLNDTDPIHPCRKGGPISNKNWKRDHQAMESRLKYAEEHGLEKHIKISANGG